MSSTLLTLNCESLLTCAAFRPEHIYILLGTKEGELYLHEIQPPEEEPSGSFDSLDCDIENKYGLHDIVLATYNLHATLRYMKWFTAEQLLVVCKEAIMELKFDGDKFVLQRYVDVADISAFHIVQKPEEKYVFPKLKFSVNAKTRALQKAVFYPLKRQKFQPYQITNKSIIYVLGTDEGELIFYDLERQYELARFHDCGDYVSAIQQVDDIVVCASGDGTVYLYRIIYEEDKFAARLEDNSMPEETDFNCMSLVDDLAFVGTADGTILAYDVSNIITHKYQLIVSKSSIESLIILPGNIVLASTDDGHVLIVSIFPNFYLIGSLTVANCSNGQILTTNDDYSLLLVGGGSANLNIEDMQWYAEDCCKKQDSVDKAYEEEFEPEEEVIYLSELHSGDDSECEPESRRKIVQEASESERLTSVSSTSESTNTSDSQPVGEVFREHVKLVKDKGQTVKIIDAGHLSDDSSFSDFFKPIKTENDTSKKANVKKNAYSASASLARRQAFLKDMDSDD